MTVQTIVNKVSQDVRSALSSTGTEATILIDYVDRVHKDALHFSLYSWMNQAETHVTTVDGTPNYNLPVADIRRILHVYDRSRERFLAPIEVASQPVSLSMAAGGNASEFSIIPPSIKRIKSQTCLPEYYDMVLGYVLHLYPTPKQMLLLDVHYEKQVATLAALGDALVLPDDATDILAAGVNALANLFLGRNEQAAAWAQLYEKLKKGEAI